MRSGMNDGRGDHGHATTRAAPFRVDWLMGFFIEDATPGRCAPGVRG
jgi:hypothetical protein